MRTIQILVLFLIAGLCIPSCDQNYDIPPMHIPEAKQVANTTILELKTTFDGNLDTIGKKDSGEDYIIKGVVVGNDISGNIYKNLMIQDGTAALTVAVNSSGLYTYYRMGQEVVINCTGLYLGKYANLQQLGYPATGKQEATFMPLAAFEEAVGHSNIQMYYM